MNQETESISKREAVEQVGAVLRRLAMLHYYYAKTLLDELGEKHGRKIIAKAIEAYGRRIGFIVRAKTLEAGLEPLPENYQSDIPGWPWPSEMAIVDGEVRERIHHCPLASEWINLGDPAIGRYYCEVDYARMEGFNPEFEYVFFKRIPDGDAYCESTVRPVKR